MTRFFFPLPNDNTPRKNNTANVIKKTAIVKPAPRKPAPTGLMSSWCVLLAVVAGEGETGASRELHPRKVVWLQTPHHCKVVLTATGSKVERKVERGTSPFPFHPLKDILWVVKSSSSVPFLKLNLITGWPPDAGWRTSITTAAAKLTGWKTERWARVPKTHLWRDPTNSRR